MDFNIQDSVDSKDSSFLYDDNINQHFFNEIIVAAGLKDWNRFKNVCDLPINWFGNFTYDKEYSGSCQNNEVTIEDNSSYFYNFLHVAASHFEDDYTYYILLKIINKKDENIKEYETFQKTAPYLIINLLSRNCIKTLEKLKNDNLITSDQILEEIFVKNYKYLTKNAMKLLKNSNIFDYYLGNKEKSIESNLLRDAKKYFKFNSLNTNRYSQTLLQLLNDLMENYPLDKKLIGDIFTKIVFESLADNNKDYTAHYHNNNVRKLVGELIAYGILDCHTICSFNRKKLIENDERQDDILITIESYFEIDKIIIANAYEKKAILLTAELEKTALIKMDKKVKI